MPLSKTFRPVIQGEILGNQRKLLSISREIRIDLKLKMLTKITMYCTMHVLPIVSMQGISLAVQTGME